MIRIIKNKGRGVIRMIGVFLLVAWLFLNIQGCSGLGEDKSDLVTLDGEETVLARVNGSAITRYELDLTIDTTVGEANASKIGEEGEQKVLESLVASRAISQACIKELSPMELAEIKKQVQAYREQLLVKKYIAKHVTPEPVSQAMVKEYYDTHPEKFGGKTVRRYEMISTSRTPSQKERDELLSLLVKPQEKKDWNKWVGSMEKMGYPVFLKQGIAVEKLLHPKVYAIIKQLGMGETSSMSFIDGRPYIVRITEESEIPPRPLAEVSSGIRKSLVPVQLKKAVRQVSEIALKNAKIDYVQ